LHRYKQLDLNKRLKINEYRAKLEKEKLVQKKWDFDIKVEIPLSYL